MPRVNHNQKIQNINIHLNINMGKKRNSNPDKPQKSRGISPKKKVVLPDGTIRIITPNDKGEYSKYYMREYRKIRGYLAGRSRKDYNEYMRVEMRKRRKKD